MIALAAITASLFAAQDPVAIAIASKWPGTETVSAKLAAQAKDALVRAELTALPEAETRARAKAAKLPDPRTCNGVRACVAKLAAALGEGTVVVSIDVGKLSNRLIVRIEAIRGDRAEPLDSLEINTTMTTWSNDSVSPLSQFARHLQELLKKKEPAPAEPPPTAATSVTLTPAPAPAVSPAHAPAPPAAVDVTPPAPAGRSRVIALTAGGVGLGSLVVSGVVMAIAFGGRSSIQGTYSMDAMGNLVSSLRRVDLDARASVVNTQFVVSAITGAVGAALLATAIALLLAS